MKIERIWAMPNRWTFKVKPIRELVERYVGDGIGWVDPFAGMNSPAEITNDLNPKMPAKYNLHALEFAESLNGQTFNGVIFDPPYSLAAMKRCYDELGVKMSAQEAMSNFSPVKTILGEKVKDNGIVICCGWNSTGFGKCRGFQLQEILLVCHGGNRLDTIVTVERKT